jgi:hypothetical protein
VYSRLIHVSTRWGATDSELVRELPGDELLPEANSTTCWCRSDVDGAGSTPTPLSRGITGADIANLDRIDPSLQTLGPGDRIWMTPERYLGRLPGQFWSVRQVEPGRALVLERKPPDSPQCAIWSLVLQPAVDGMARLLDRHRSEPPTGAFGPLSDAFWLLGTLLTERGMLRGIKARAERAVTA